MPRDPLRVRLYQRAERWHNQLSRAVDGIHRGLWLGLLDGPQLDATTARYYRSLPKYRERQYNLSGLWFWEEAVLERHFAACRSLLVASTGGGREVIALAQRGLIVDGFECNQELVAFAEALIAEAGVEARVLYAPVDSVPAGLSTYDGIVVGWGAYIHIQGRDARVAFLRRLREHVEVGAPLLLSFFERQDPSRHDAVVYAVARALRALRRSEQPLERGDRVAGSFDHHFTRDEISAELSRSGFELVCYQGRNEAFPHAVARAR